MIVIGKKKISHHRYEKRPTPKSRKMLLGYAARDAYLWKMGFSSYNKYLNSDLWKEIRANVLFRDHYKCAVCGIKASQVHHLDYTIKALSGESLTDLISICVKCHKEVEFVGEEKLDLQEMQYLFRETHGRYDKESLSSAKKKLNFARISLARMQEQLKNVVSPKRFINAGGRARRGAEPLVGLSKSDARKRLCLLQKLWKECRKHKKFGWLGFKNLRTEIKSKQHCLCAYI